MGIETGIGTTKIEKMTQEAKSKTKIGTRETRIGGAKGMRGIGKGKAKPTRGIETIRIERGIETTRIERGIETTRMERGIETTRIEIGEARGLTETETETETGEAKTTRRIGIRVETETQEAKTGTETKQKIASGGCGRKTRKAAAKTKARRITRTSLTASMTTEKAGWCAAGDKILCA